MTVRVPRAPALAALAAALLGGCGGGVATDDADLAARADPRGWASAALRPLLDLAGVGLEVARFAAGPAGPLVLSGAASADTLLSLPARPGSFFLDWFDADRDAVLSSGDGVRLDFGYNGANGRPARATGHGVHLPELVLRPGRIEAASVFIDLAAPPEDSVTATLAGTCAFALDHGPVGERLRLTRGTSPLRWRAGGRTALVDSIDATLEVHAFAGTWRFVATAALRDGELGALSLTTGTPFSGRLEAGLPGAAGSGSLFVHRALGGTLRLLVTGPGRVRLSLDADDDGIYDQVVEAGWRELVPAAD